MLSFPNAKINVGLYITKKRDDGYHNIISCFYPVEWSDILEISPNKKQTQFKSTGISIPGDVGSNLCLKAYDLLRHDFDIPPVHIHLHKLIPIGAGMGGGSSDGAFALKMLNELYELQLNTTQLEKYAAKLGSDCPFFVQNKPVIAIDKGDTFEPCELSLKGKYILLIYPNKHISTAEAYANISPKDLRFNFQQFINKPINHWRGQIQNDFELSLKSKYPYIEELKEQLYSLGAAYASLTGSGSTVYGIFNSKPEETLWKNYSTKIIDLTM